ncbi:hypothetical protein D3875_03560 [Deinococcus cavernae]|uniref:Uncharacterized protein n=1 Tax=Deinococcus cavernae TaxID=2320857 RepID=A0A418VEU1_9DEIO|nr:hypothetical protein [Deinococcus cavernae]RJF74631.1 hypothetical protein D3875_03560 [Deinococcus cavernae]
MYAADEHHPDEITSRPDPRAAPIRANSTEAAAENMRQQRRQYAQRLREARRALDAGHPEGRARLERIRAQAGNVPNPDRRRDCARAATLAEARYRELEGTTHTASIDAAARHADLMAVLQLTAQY